MDRKEFVDLLQELAIAHKKACDYRDVGNYSTANEEFKVVSEAVDKLSASGHQLKSDDLSGLKPDAAANVVYGANQLAYAQMIKVEEANEPIYDKAKTECDEIYKQCEAVIAKAFKLHEANPSDQSEQNYKEVKEAQEKLKKQASDALIAADKPRMDALNAYKRQRDENNRLLKAMEQAQQLQGSSSPKATVVSDQNKAILELYKEKFKADDWYQKKENQPQQHADGKLSIPFKTQKDMTDFSIEAAKKNNFMIVDGATNKVMGYSRGGKLYHHDNKEVKAGDIIRPGEKTRDQFKMPPEPKNPPLSPPSGTPTARQITDTVQNSAQSSTPPGSDDVAMQKLSSKDGPSGQELSSKDGPSGPR